MCIAFLVTANLFLSSFSVLIKVPVIHCNHYTLRPLKIERESNPELVGVSPTFPNVDSCFNSTRAALKADSYFTVLGHEVIGLLVVQP